jgi:hypothetical protein
LKTGISGKEKYQSQWGSFMTKKEYNENDDERERNKMKNKNNRYSPETKNWENMDYVKFIEDFQRKWHGQKKMRGPYRRY